MLRHANNVSDVYFFKGKQAGLHLTSPHYMSLWAAHTAVTDVEYMSVYVFFHAHYIAIKHAVRIMQL